MSYAFENTLLEGGGAFEDLWVAGILEEMESTPPAFMVGSRSGLGLLRRSQKEITVNEDSSHQLVGKIDGYYYYYYPNTALASTDEQEIAWETEAAALVKAMLTTKSNITKI